MKLRAQRSQWDKLGRIDPLWAILTDPARRGGGWDPRDFFATGAADVAAAVAWTLPFGVPRRHGSALDFGCGVGRLTQALAGYFEHVTGVDVAPAMLEHARRYNCHGDRCSYVLNDRDNLSLFPDGAFDMVYSAIVLQHLPPRHIRSYLAEFLRVLQPGGLLLFQLPAEHRYRGLRHRLTHTVYSTVMRKFLRRPCAMDMYGLPRAEVETLLAARGGRLLDVREDGFAGGEWLSYTYAVTR